MLTYFVALFLSALCAFTLTPLLRDLAEARGAVDEGTEERKVHDRPTPRVGGVAIALAFFLPVIGLFFWDNRVSQIYHGDAGRFLGLLLGAMVMVLLGLVDDLRGVRARTKLVVQLIVAICAFFLGYSISKIATPFGDPIALGWLSFPVTVLWIVGIGNAFNLIDGLDGLASGIALFTVAILFLLGVVNNNVIVGLTAIALMGALIGFLPYNFNPASIFMGDSGSLFIGYVLAVTAISGSSKSSTVVSLLIPLLAMGLPVMDTLLAVFRRFLSGRRLFEADRGHVHHRLLDRGLTHRQAVLVLYGGCAFLALGALSLVYANSALSAVILAAMATATVAFSWALGYLSWDEVRRSVRYGLMRQQGLRDRLANIEDTARAIRAATSVSEAFDTLVERLPDLEIDQLLVRADVGSAEGVCTFEARWPGREPGTRTMLYQLEYPLDWGLGDVRVTGFVHFGWHCGEEQLQIPEAATYDWLAMVLRDRLLELTRDGAQGRFRPGLARTGDG